MVRITRVMPSGILHKNVLTCAKITNVEPLSAGDDRDSDTPANDIQHY